MQKLGKEMKLISSMVFIDETKPLIPNLRELADVRKEFLGMKSAIMYFGKYVPVEVVKLLLRDNVNNKLSLRNESISVMFSDIASFTTIAEGLHPDKLVQLLEQYFSAMSDIILLNEGTIDK